MVKQPLISIILTTYNRVHFVEEMLSCILKQTYTNWECIIIDDNSIDNTKQVITNFIEEDNRFTFVIKPNIHKKGLPSSRNIGINKAKGDYLVFFDDDDYIHEKLLEICVKEFLNDKSISFVHYQKKPFTGVFKKESFKNSLNNNKSILEGNIYEKIVLRQLQIASCTIVWKTNLLKENQFNESLMYAEEWECYSRIFILKNLIGLKLDSILYFNRKHSNSNTGEFSNKNSIRINSYIDAHTVVSNLLVEKNKMTKLLKNFFFTQSYLLNSKKIVNSILQKNKFEIIKYQLFRIKYGVYAFLKKNKLIKQ
ncbi:glycosyltransferase family 2 protein [Polaribacter batillariae]|uniref:Glycosyltransferase family 2 protein n=1 Tax=Polaribacter batillariae TaxID=2808900 RepID=A0ABX7SW79_9FLAO|nr:glycosyltransferase family A protein [Polaribacter batillariae]QTD37560.1 glycosyltransferase family 2 protein [Polaribacter batillariae]